MPLTSNAKYTGYMIMRIMGGIGKALYIIFIENLEKNTFHDFYKPTVAASSPKLWMVTNEY